MNIFKHEFSIKLKSVLTWSVSIAALIFVFLSLYPSFAADKALLGDLLASFPKELLIAFGMQDMNWYTVLGYFGMLFVFCQICLAIQAANYGFGLVSIEESEWTADFLLTKPIRRSRILTSKLLAAVASLAITEACIWLSSFAAIAIFSGGEEIQRKALISLLLSMSAFQLFFLSVGIVISLIVKRVRSVTPFSMGLVFGLYILNAFGGMIGEKSLEVLSPFKHFTPTYIIQHNAWDWPLAMISMMVTLVSLIASYFLYERRNIASAV